MHPRGMVHLYLSKIIERTHDMVHMLLSSYNVKYMAEGQTGTFKYFSFRVFGVAGYLHLHNFWLFYLEPARSWPFSNRTGSILLPSYPLPQIKIKPAPMAERYNA